MAGDGDGHPLGQPRPLRPPSRDPAHHRAGCQHGGEHRRVQADGLDHLGEVLAPGHVVAAGAAGQGVLGGLRPGEGVQAQLGHAQPVPHPLHAMVEQPAQLGHRRDGAQALADPVGQVVAEALVQAGDRLRPPGVVPGDHRRQWGAAPVQWRTALGDARHRHRHHPPPLVAHPPQGPAHRRLEGIGGHLDPLHRVGEGGGGAGQPDLPAGLVDHHGLDRAGADVDPQDHRPGCRHQLPCAAGDFRAEGAGSAGARCTVDWPSKRGLRARPTRPPCERRRPRRRAMPLAARRRRRRPARLAAKEPSGRRVTAPPAPGAPSTGRASSACERDMFRPPRWRPRGRCRR